VDEVGDGGGGDVQVAEEVTENDEEDEEGFGVVEVRVASGTHGRYYLKRGR